MITAQFLAEWALRSSLLILSGAFLLRALRVKDPSIRLAAWTATLCGSLVIPLLSSTLPKMPLPVRHTQARQSEAWRLAPPMATPAAVNIRTHGKPAPAPANWPLIMLTAYLVVAASLLLRLGIGLAMSRRLTQRSRATGRMEDGIEIRESDDVAAPVALGVARPVIVLPAGWNRWDDVKLNAVLAHERSHIWRRDPAVQMLSAIHRALTWHSPLSWILHRCIVRTAEEASDDAAIAAACDRESYAEILLDFMKRGVIDTGLHGVAMARYTPPEQRIHRILDGSDLSRGVTRWTVAVILILGSPLAWVAAAAHPQEPPAPIAAATPAAPQTPELPAFPAQPPTAATPPTAAAAPTPAAPEDDGRQLQSYMVVLGDDSVSGSWNSGGGTDREGLRAKYGRNFAWFRRAGLEFVVTDAGVMAEFERAMLPQRDVNRMQDGVNSEQSRVNAMQDAVNSRQNEVNGLQEQVNHRQDIANRLQESIGRDDNKALTQKLQAAIDDLRTAKESVSQDMVNRRQSDVNQEQDRVNSEQSKVNKLQSKVNQQQNRVSADYNRNIEEIFDSAIQRHLARQLN